MMLNDAIDVLAHVLSPSSVIETILRDTLKLQPKSARRHVLWQELCSYLAAGKVLSAVAQAFPLAGLENGKGPLEWLADGKLYAQWLARNICHAAMATAVAENEAWSMLAQLLKRSLSLGQSGKPRVLSCCQLCSYGMFS
jgi:telomere length regulation protein